MKETFIFAVCLTVAAALAFYLLAMQELGEMGRGPGVATLKQLKKMNEITLKDPDATTAKVLEEMSRLTRKDDDSTKVRRVATTTQPKRQSKLHRQLEAAIAKAEQTVAEAEEASQEDDLGASERRFLATELKQMSAEARARADAIERRGNKKTIREVRLGEVKAAKLRLEELKAELAKVEAEEEF